MSKMGPQGVGRIIGNMRREDGGSEVGEREVGTEVRALKIC